MLSLKDNTFNKTYESNSDGFHDSLSMENKKEKKIVNRVQSLFLTIIKEKESIDNNNNE